MALGALIGLAVFWLQGWSFPTPVPAGTVVPDNESYLAGAVRAAPGTIEHLVGYVLLFALALGVPSWSDYVRRRRRERFSLGPVFVAGLVAFLLWLGWSVFLHSSDDLPAYTLVALAGAAGVVQMVTPWTPPPPPQPKRRRLEYA
jgi:hypothetical protein